MPVKKAAVFFGIFIVGLIAAASLRTWLVLYGINPDTGFYYNNSSVTVLAMNILLLVFAVLLLLPVLLPGFKNIEASPNRSPAMGVLTAILALCFAADAFHEFYLIIAGSDALTTLFNIIGEFLAAGFFAMLSGMFFKAEEVRLPIGSLLPVIWAVIHLMGSFMHYTTVVSISGYLFDMLKMVFMMIFLYYHARYTGRAQNGKEIRGMLAFGLSAAFFSLLAILPGIFAHLAGGSAQINPTDDLLYIALTVYILVTLVRIFFINGNAKMGSLPAQQESKA